MDNPRCGFLSLPLELRYLVYESCFKDLPVPSLLHINRQIHDEVTHYLRKCQQTFTFNISGQGASFDPFSQWCFKVKRHTPKLGRTKHLILNIHPPNPDRPIEMWYIWNHIKTFCKDLASQKQISRLTVVFVENKKLAWATNRVAQNSMQLTTYGPDFTGDDVGATFVTLAHLVTNVSTPKIILPVSYINSSSNINGQAQSRANQIEQLMTGDWEEEGTDESYEVLENAIEVSAFSLKRRQGERSKAKFQSKYGRSADVRKRQLDREWPHMDDLDPLERPVFRNCCEAFGCRCGGTDAAYIDVSMPDPSWARFEYPLYRDWASGESDYWLYSDWASGVRAKDSYVVCPCYNDRSADCLPPYADRVNPYQVKWEKYRDSWGLPPDHFSVRR